MSTTALSTSGAAAETELAEQKPPTMEPVAAPAQAPATSPWDIAWVSELGGIKTLKQLQGYETFTPVLRFEDCYDEMKNVGEYFPVKYLDIPAVESGDLYYTPKFIMDKGEKHDESYLEMERDMQTYYDDCILKHVVIPNEKLYVGMYAVTWDKTQGEPTIYRRVKLLARRYRIRTCENFKILVDQIDYGVSTHVPWRNVVFLEKRFAQLPRRVLYVQMDNLKDHVENVMFENTVKLFLGNDENISMNILKFYPADSLRRMSAVVQYDDENQRLIHGVTGGIVDILGGYYSRRFREMLLKKNRNNGRRFTAFVMYLDETTGNVFMQSDSAFYQHFQALYNTNAHQLAANAGNWKQISTDTYYFAPYKDGLQYRCIVQDIDAAGKAHVEFVDEGDCCVVEPDTLVRACKVHPLFDVLPEMKFVAKLYCINDDKVAIQSMRTLLQDIHSDKVIVQIEKVTTVSKPGQSDKAIRVKIPYVSFWGFYKFGEDTKRTFTDLNRVALSLSRKETPMKYATSFTVPEENVLVDIGSYVPDVKSHYNLFPESN